MDAREKIANRLLAQAAKTQQTVLKQERRGRRPDRTDGPPQQLYCARCYAMLKTDRSCPKCEHGETNYFAYCRKCLTVHAAAKACTTWQAGTCRWCHTVHVDPRSDCPCSRCHVVHDGEPCPRA